MKTAEERFWSKAKASRSTARNSGSNSLPKDLGVAVTEPFRTIVADCPWQFGDSLPGKTRGASKQYQTMTVSEICDFPLPLIADDALLFLWRVSAMQEEALRVMRAWGFEPKSEIVWIKTGKNGKPCFGMGRYVRASHETCLIGRRGKGRVVNRSIRSVFEAPRLRHSQKPERFFEIVEQLTDGPRLELFARRKREGWTCMGNEL